MPTPATPIGPPVTLTTTGFALYAASVLSRTVIVIVFIVGLGRTRLTFVVEPAVIVAVVLAVCARFVAVTV